LINPSLAFSIPAASSVRERFGSSSLPATLAAGSATAGPAMVLYLRFRTADVTSAGNTQNSNISADILCMDDNFGPNTSGNLLPFFLWDNVHFVYIRLKRTLGKMPFSSVQIFRFGHGKMGKKFWISVNFNPNGCHAAPLDAGRGSAFTPYHLPSVSLPGLSVDHMAVRATAQGWVAGNDIWSLSTAEYHQEQSF
jgi:hypothetical protein